VQARRRYGWLFDSPIPDSRWLPGRTERIADGRETLRRRFGEAREEPRRPAVRLRDLGSAHPFVSGTRVVGGDVIEAELESEITTINPPILQGWAYVLVPLVGVGMLAGLALLAGPRANLPLGIALLAGAPAAWLALLVLVGLRQRGLVLVDDGIHIRTWVEAWLGRSGQLVGRPDATRASLSGPLVLMLSGPDGERRLAMKTWPGGAIDDVVDELPLWGVDCDFGHHHQGGHRRRRPVSGGARRWRR
jgi:hypothetical protein